MYFVSGWKLCSVSSHNNINNSSSKKVCAFEMHVAVGVCVCVIKGYTRENHRTSQLHNTFHQLPFLCLDPKLKAVGPHIHIDVASVASVSMKSQPSQWCTR